MSHIVGIKIRALREELGLTQEDLAKSIGLSSEFISHLELGKRDPSLESLSGLALFFKKDLSYFLVEAPDDLEVLLATKETAPESRRLLKRFGRYCQDYMRLEELAERPLRQAPLYSSLSARKMAAEERRRLGLGLEPISDMVALAERNGLRIALAPLLPEGELAGVFVFYESRQAAFALVDSRISPERRNFAAAHAYCHYLKDRLDGPIIDTPDMLVDDYVSLYPGREQFAHRFAVHFLMPPDRIRDIIDREIRVESLRLADVLYLRRYFGVELSRLAFFLEKMGSISGRTRQLLLKTDQKEAELALFGPDPVPKGAKGKSLIPSERFRSLVLTAYQKGRLDLDSLAKYLKQPREKIRPFISRKI
jgi:transcriptional regulator with XRE-family HTH domain